MDRSQSPDETGRPSEQHPRHLGKTASPELEGALRDFDYNYRRLFEAAQEGITISTRSGKILDVNPAAEQILGYSREELLAMPAQQLYVDPEAREVGQRKTADHGAICDFEVRFRRKDGRVIVCQLSSSVHRGEDGAVQLFETFFRDVTERKRDVRALKESEEKFRALVEEAIVGVAFVQGGRFKYVNERYAEIMGYEPTEMIDALSAEAVVHPDDRPKVREMIRRRVEGEVDVVRYHTRIRTKAGRTRHVEVHGRGFMYQGRPALIASVLDVTERRRLQREILSMQEEERRRLGQDLHDGVASQLTGVGLMLGALARRLKKGTVSADQIVEAIVGVRGLVSEAGDDVRRFSRGLAPAGLSGGDLEGALERLANNTEGGAFEQEIEELPELEKGAAAHLYWIAQEATANAQRHAEADQIVIRLVGGESDALALEVEDDGRGFDPGCIKEEEGLGLRTMRYRADLLGATLTIDATPGEGTCVRCRLPG